MKGLQRRISAYVGGEPLFPLAVLFGLTTADQIDTQAFTVLAPNIAKHFDVSESALGSIAILVLVVGPILGMPLAHLADRWKRVPIAIGGAVIWTVFSVLTGLAPSLWFLIVARVIATSGEIVNTPVHSSIMADSYSPPTRMKAFGIYTIGQTVGGALGAFAAGELAHAYGFRVPFLVLAVPTVLVILMAMRLPEPERGRFEAIETPVTPPLTQTVRELWRLRSLRYQWIGTAFAAAGLIPARIIFQFYLDKDFGVNEVGRGYILGVGTAFTLPAIIYGSAYVTRRLDVAPSKGLRTISLIGGAAGALMITTAGAPSIWVVVPLLWLIVMLFAVLTPALLTVTATIASPETRSTAFALQGVVALAGVPLALVGALLGDVSLRGAMVYLGVLFLIGIRYFFIACRYVDADVARLDPARQLLASAGVNGSGEPLPDVLLQTQGVTVSYSGVQVLFGVDLEIREGEIVALLGTNGAGKSTILNAISGVVEPDGGNVWFEGQAITGEAPERTVARGIVQVPGGRGVFPRLTVEDNLAMGGFLLRKDKALLASRTAEVLDLFPRLRERYRQPAGVLSGGERQMLTLAQSFLLKPKLLLIDELSLGLAPTVVQELLVALREINAAGTAVVLVEQSVNVALTLADRAYFMEKGEVRFSGPTSELLHRADLLRSVFLEGAGAHR
jgi:ABC-type branched-subunit amino acid transport system ATPase component/MFS family permease